MELLQEVSTLTDFIRSDLIRLIHGFASHRNAAYDPADNKLTAIPKFERFNFNPKLFLYLNENTELNFGVNAVFEDRIGGNIDYIKMKANTLTAISKNKTKT
jgi:iron complex outermembrane receptor protein